MRPAVAAVPCRAAPLIRAPASNSQAHTRALDGVLSSAQAKFHAGAYLHQYAQHGVEQEEFVQAFASLEQVLLAYSQLGR